MYITSEEKWDITRRLWRADYLSQHDYNNLSFEEWCRKEPELGRFMIEFHSRYHTPPKNIQNLYDELTDMIKVKNQIKV